MVKGGSLGGVSPRPIFSFVFFSIPATCFGSLFPFLHTFWTTTTWKVGDSPKYPLLATSLDIWEIGLVLVLFGLLAELFPAEFLCFARQARGNCRALEWVVGFVTETAKQLVSKWDFREVLKRGETRVLLSWLGVIVACRGLQIVLFEIYVTLWKLYRLMEHNAGQRYSKFE